MPRLSILPALLIGLPLIGCAQPPASSPAQTAATAPSAPVGSHVVGAAADPFTLTIGPAEVASAPPESTANVFRYSNAAPFVTITGH